MKGEVGLDHENLEKLFLEKVKLKIEEWGGGGLLCEGKARCVKHEKCFGRILSLGALKFYLLTT